MTYLNQLGIDTVIATGCTTSGCIRASVIDAFSYAFKVIVPEDGVYDRSDVAHAVNLFDINSKYGDVLPTEEILDQLAGMPERAVTS